MKTLVFYYGFVPAHREGDLRVIRPFVYVREKDLRNFAESQKLPVIPENCPACFEAPKVRYCVCVEYLVMSSQYYHLFKVHYLSIM